MKDEIINDLKDEYWFRKKLTNDLKSVEEEELPSDIEIEQILAEAYNDAKSSADNLGIIVKEDFVSSLMKFYSETKEHEKLVVLADPDQEMEDAEEFFEYQGIRFLNEKNGKI